MSHSTPEHSAPSVPDRDQPAPQPLPDSLQDLPPAQAHVCLGVERFLLHECGLPAAGLKGHGVLVACSGGCDSSALLLMLHCLRQRLGIRLAVAHLDHNLRPESADEARHVAALAERLSLPCIVGSTDIAACAVQRRQGVEETAREERYAFLNTARLQHDCTYIATAHHLNDLAEDVLMRLIRGTGWPALGGMEAFCPHRMLIRPLLVTKRNKLADFLTSLGIDWCEDASNNDRAYLRNRIRHDFMPLFLQENPSFAESVATLWRHARTDAEHWDAVIGTLLTSHDKNTSSQDSLTNLVYSPADTQNASDRTTHTPSADTQPVLLPGSLLDGATKALRLRLYKKCLDSLGTGQALHENLLRLDIAWMRRSGGACVQFPGGKKATITGGNIRFSRG